MSISARPLIIHHIWTFLCLFGLLTIVACSNPDNAQARLGLVKENMRRADYGAASLELANLIQSKPDHLEARLLQGKVSLAAGRADSAEAQLLYARELGAPGRLVYQPLAQAIIAQGTPQRIIAALGPEPSEEDDRKAWLIARGMAALHVNQPGEAEQFFTDVMRTDKESLDARLGLAAVQTARGDLESASVYIENATRTHPLSIAAWQALGALRYEQGRLVDAERAFINAIEGSDGLDRVSEYMLARVGLIETQWHLDKKSLAKQNTKELIDSYPWHPLPKFTRGLLAFLDGEYTTAGDYLYRVVSALPDHQPSLKLLAAINSSQGKLGRAQLYLDKYFALNDSDPEMLILLSETYLQMGNASQAVSSLQPIITDSATDAIRLDLYGTACRYSPSCENGQHFLSRAVQSDPQNVRRQTRLAAAYLNLGDLDSADALMSTWVPPELVTESSRQVLRLERFMRSDQLSRATEYAKKLRRKNPANLHALLALAEVAHMRGETEEESAWLELARERNPAAVEPRLIQATRHLLKQRYGQAVVVAQEAAAAHPYNANVLRILAHALIRSGRYDEALSTAAEAHRLAPSQEPNLLVLIHAHLIKRDKTRATELIEELLGRNERATEAMTPVLIDLYQRDMREVAHETLNTIAMLGGAPDVIAEIEGDLFLMEERNDLAYTAYNKARSLGSNRMRELKTQLANSQMNTSSYLRH